MILAIRGIKWEEFLLFLGCSITKTNFPMKYLLWPMILALFLGCGPKSPELPTGNWRGIIDVQGQEMPFNFRLEKNEESYLVYLINASEEIELDEVYREGDSLIMNMHIFDSDIRARISEEGLSGFWQKKYIDGYRLSFRATAGEEERFYGESGDISFDGRWRVNFSDNDSIYSVGIFNQSETGRITGTFLNAKGDYRSLEGKVLADTLHLSTFDGSHAYLFKAHYLNESTLDGKFFDGLNIFKTWRAIKDENAQLPDANQLTFLKEGYDSIYFSFPSLEGEPVSLSDSEFRNKVVILQLFGSWCPNCMDESKFLSKWYRENKQEDLAILGLAYESKEDFDYASTRVSNMKRKLGIEYDFVIAGVNDKLKAAETLPMLNHVMAFPTMIFIDKKGTVRKIHTGFSGPGTGEYYDQFVQEFDNFVKELLEE